MIKNLISQEQLIILSTKVIRIGVILLLGLIGQKIVLFLIKRFTKKVRKSRVSNQRLATISSILEDIAAIVIKFALILILLTELGVDIIPLLTGVGILGLAIGMGAKDLAADLISGFFVIFENHFNVGDTIQAAKVSGRVKTMSLRTVTLKDRNGNIHIIPNSALKTITKVKVKKSKNNEAK